MPLYYTEYPTGVFKASSDMEAKKNPANVIYRESDSPNGQPFVIVKEQVNG